MIHNIPIFAEPTYQSLTKLILRNNNLTTLEGKIKLNLNFLHFKCCLLENLLRQPRSIFHVY